MIELLEKVINGVKYMRLKYVVDNYKVCDDSIVFNATMEQFRELERLGYIKDNEVKILDVLEDILDEGDTIFGQVLLDQDITYIGGVFTHSTSELLGEIFMMKMDCENNKFKYFVRKG